MELGRCLLSMSDLLDELGLEEDHVEWYHLAACKNMDINWFYDKYEDKKEDPNRVHAKQVDDICLSCPVAAQCLLDGVESKGYGVWGGIYLNLGRVDRDMNEHKTPEIWKALKKKHGRGIV